MRRISVLLLIFTLCSCTVRTYSGPAKSANEISNITINRQGEITIEQVEFDGKELSSILSDNIESLPGRHEFKLYYKTELQGRCYHGETFCELNVARGVCEGWLSMLPGRNYLVTVENKYSFVEIRLAAKGYFDFSERTDEPNFGGGSCHELSSYDTLG